MKLAIVVDGLAMGGAESQAAVLAVEFRRQGVDAGLIAYHPRNDFTAFLAEHQVPLRVLDARTRPGRVVELTRIFKQERFEIVHAFVPHAAIWALPAARLAGIHRVYSFYRMTVRPPLAWRLLHRSLSFGLTGWASDTETGRRLVMRDFGVPGERVLAVPNGVDPRHYHSDLTREEARLRLGIPEGEAVISLVANLRPEKGHAMFVSVARKLVARGAKARFLLVGDGPDRERVRELVEASGIAERVQMLGYHPRVGDVWRATDIGVITSPKEGGCIALLEAGASGLPAVTTDNGGGGEIILDGETGFVVGIEDESTMVERILRLLGDPELRERLGAAARRRILGGFTPESGIRKLLAFYERTSG